MLKDRQHLLIDVSRHGLNLRFRRVRNACERRLEELLQKWKIDAAVNAIQVLLLVLNLI